MTARALTLSSLFQASADKQKTVEVGAELFVGNLDPMVDEKTLYDTFSRFGSLVVAPKVYLLSPVLLGSLRQASSRERVPLY
jgi:RNA recognition motif-containing protein